jgi:hypothetical protein
LRRPALLRFDAITSMKQTVLKLFLGENGSHPSNQGAEK